MPGCRLHDPEYVEHVHATVLIDVGFWHVFAADHDPERDQDVRGGDVTVVGEVAAYGFVMHRDRRSRVSPAPSVAMTVIVFSPSGSVTFAIQVSVPLAGSPFTVTDAMPDGSDAVPVTVVRGVELVISSGDMMVSSGGVVSAPDASMRKITRPLFRSATYA